MELESLLRGLGCIVVDTASTISQALRALERECPDLAVLDVNLQGQRVTPIAETLQAQGVPFVLVTGYGSERLAEKALQDVPCLRKPVDGGQLANAISDVLARLESG